MTATLPSTIGISQAAADAAYFPVFTQQAASPTAGATVQVNSDSKTNTTLWLTPAGTLATLTINLPNDATSPIGMMCNIGSNKIISILTLANAASILGAPTALALGDFFSMQKVAANTWVKNT